MYLNVLFLTVIPLVTASPSVTDVLQDIYMSCIRHLSVNCVQPKAINWLSTISEGNEIKISEDLLITKNGKFSENKNKSEDIYEKFEDFLQNYDLTMRIPKILYTESSVARTMPKEIKVPLAVTGRSSKLIKKVILPFLLGLKFKTAVVVPITLAIIALKTWKALTLGLLSLVLTGALLIFRLTKPKVVNYEVIHYPQHVEHPAPGWEHAGYGRHFDHNKLAYNDYLF
ncbi:hypothetical protein NQ317_013986 [Molorchus minor]|uniref:Osiris 18 n=1 Tax=Molorchus minor TaxID=1323400 RepID=A0ABQ9JHH1_9CUCU|nr:hypothetical protein NQ317_013986 [Molorchus minor]